MAIFKVLVICKVLVIPKRTEILHAQNLTYIQIWYTHPFVYIVYVYKRSFEHEA